MSLQVLRARTQGFMRHWFAIEALPLVGIIGFALSGGSWFLYRGISRPDVIWTRSNPQPWNDIHEGESPKILDGHHKFDHRWSRPRL
ncbi:hypothetical protein EXIGLDRAFT_724720 [Exidia glandulosa HHB12029]|uniref:Uncharacterized protein n=1 Tax=Exidia glandulosa HHB12029 TaxID=1314781 RepID=A0A165E4V1_EXIGL|nr:hypothetical protein EXIGLDRAFT_725189 [Exidia glandulosa HHB12029]KZV86505.1 hypothetical protein EXIGLDRAFT_724720 [Exidia glandulosa HHB12029]